MISMCKSVAINKKGRLLLRLLLVFFILSAFASMAAGDNTSSPVTITTEKLSVTGGTPQPAAPVNPASPVTITTEKLTATGGIPRPPAQQAPFNPVTTTTEKLTVTGK
jgi:hypothetical protein